jgi:predicted methyltransferase
VCAAKRVSRKLAPAAGLRRAVDPKSVRLPQQGEPPIGGSANRAYARSMMARHDKENIMRTYVPLTIAAALATLATPAAAQQNTYRLPGDTPAHVRSAVESAERTEEQRARDADRKPAEILTLAGIEPGDRVIELASFGHYFTTLLVEAVGPDGHVYMIDMPWTDRFGGEAARAFDSAHDNATYVQAHYNEAEFPSDVDVVMNVLFYHDLARDEVDTADMNRKLLGALKPGGRYVVIDHNAESGSGWRDAETLHRIDPDTIREEVTAAGFELETDSDLLANPDDDRTQSMRAEALRGHTDQAVLVFRKPE